ncbi:MAG: AAA family ATPase [Solirubrobacteraceae bacterium]
MASTVTNGLLEREASLAALAAIVDRAIDGRGAAVLVRAAAGLGKTSLLREASSIAEDRGLYVLRTRGLEHETEHPFGAVQRLFAPVLRRSPHAGDPFTGAAAVARTVLAGVDDGAPGPDGYAALNGLYWLVAHLVDDQPLALVVDDVQWLDDRSAAFLTFLRDRLDDLPVALLAAARPTHDGAPRSARDVLTDRLGAHPMVLAPLSRAAVDTLITATLGPRPRALVTACGDVTGGNPFLLTQLATELRRDPDGVTVEQVHRLAPDGVTRAVAARLESAGEDATVLARAAAVLGDGAPLFLAARLAGLPLPRAVRAADDLVAVDVLTLTAGPTDARDPAPSITFAHPLIRHAVYRDRAAFARATAHGAAARLADAAGLPISDVAAHLRKAPPAGDPWVVDRLRRAADDALGLGDPAVAADHLERALREPPPPDGRAAVMLALADAEAMAHRSGAISRYQAVLRAEPPASERARAVAGLARILTVEGRPDEAIDLLEPSLLSAIPAAHEEALRIDLLVVAQMYPRLRARLRPHVTALREATFSAETATGRLLLALQGVERSLVGDPLTAVRASLHAALDGGRLLAQETSDSHIVHQVGNALTQIGDHGTAIVHRHAAIADARARGSVTAYATGIALRGVDRLRAGQLTAAEEDLREGLVLTREHRPAAAPLFAGFLVETLIARGEVADARALFDASRPDASGTDGWDDVRRVALGRLRLAEGDAAGAADDLEATFRAQQTQGIRHTPFDADGVRALVRSGRRERATEIASSELRSARRSGAPRLLGMALRARGLAEGGDAGLAMLEESAAVLESAEARLEHAGALVDLGAALRRRKRRRDARDRLEAGLTIAVELWAGAMVETATTELQTLGARPRRAISPDGVGALTASERRVARMARDGMQNREIAQALFVTTKTVETHLSSTYRKLGIGSRRDLRHAIPDGN